MVTISPRNKRLVPSCWTPKTARTIVLICIVLAFGLSAYPQAADIFGEYSIEKGDERHHIAYKLALYPDGTFHFNAITTTAKPPQEVVKSAKGTWRAEGHLVTFFSEDDNSTSYDAMLDFNGTRARFITKPLRDKTDRVIPTRLRFFESNIFWIKGLVIPKV